VHIYIYIIHIVLAFGASFGSSFDASFFIIEFVPFGDKSDGELVSIANIDGFSGAAAARCEFSTSRSAHAPDGAIPNMFNGDRCIDWI